MSSLKCEVCGHMTNTAVSNHLHSRNGMANGCYMRWVEGKPEKGCRYDAASQFDKRFVDKYLAKVVQKEDPTDATV